MEKLTIEGFLAEKGWSDTDLGARAGVSGAMIARLRLRTVTASARTVVAIVVASGGRIDPWSVPMTEDTRAGLDLALQHADLLRAVQVQPAG